MLYHAFAAAALLATSVVAQGTRGLPSCATSCITNYGGCNQVDVECICTNQALLTQLSCCVSQKCDPDQIQAVVQFADTLCGSYGVTTLPQAASCSGTATGSYTSTGTASSVTSTMVGTVSSSPASASASATGTAAGTAASASGTSESTESSASESSASASDAASESGSYAGKSYKAEGMGIGMAVLGFLAAL